MLQYIPQVNIAKVMLVGQKYPMILRQHFASIDKKAKQVKNAMNIIRNTLERISERMEDEEKTTQKRTEETPLVACWPTSRSVCCFSWLFLWRRGVRLPFGYYSHIISKSVSHKRTMTNEERRKNARMAMGRVVR